MVVDEGSADQLASVYKLCCSVLTVCYSPSGKCVYKLGAIWASWGTVEEMGSVLLSVFLKCFTGSELLIVCSQVVNLCYSHRPAIQ